MYIVLYKRTWAVARVFFAMSHISVLKLWRLAVDRWGVPLEETVLLLDGNGNMKALNLYH